MTLAIRYLLKCIYNCKIKTESKVWLCFFYTGLTCLKCESASAIEECLTTLSECQASSEVGYDIKLKAKMKNKILS